MKKLYIAPEVEITRFNTEDIMAGSVIEPVSSASADTYASAGAKVSISYEDLYVD